MIPQGFRFSLSETEKITCLLYKIVGWPLSEHDHIGLHDFYGNKEPRDIFGADGRQTETERYFFTKLKKIGKRFSRNVGKGTWSNKGLATPIFGSDRGVILGYRRTFRYRPATVTKNSDEWLMNEYVLTDTALKSNSVKEECKNYALCVLKKKKNKNSDKGSFSCTIPVANDAAFREVGPVDADVAVTDYCIEKESETTVTSFGNKSLEFLDFEQLPGDDRLIWNNSNMCPVISVPPPPLINDNDVASDEDWIRELEESMDRDEENERLEKRVDNCEGRLLADESSDMRVMMIKDDDDEDWIHELEESMDRDGEENECLEKRVDINCEEGRIVSVDESSEDAVRVGGPTDDDGLEKELLDFFDFELPADDHALWENLPDDGRFFWRDECSSDVMPVIAAK